MKRFAPIVRFSFSLAAAAMLGTGCGPADELSEAELEESQISTELNKLDPQWKEVRKALVKYKDVNAALADGYINTEFCDSRADGAAMGVHFLHPGLSQDLVSDPFKPEILLYLPDGEGGYIFIGPEYWQADAGQGTPSVLGQGFDGPMPGHTPDMPVHYDLHVWLYKYNPDGLFAQFNPLARCK
ncbi:MAG TPA: hypothetical protein VLQ93_00910 [Myxococcaceae bacterium]|nr:hypothetical protein [Myxococcaceae bacterium]